jgi:hypothetical protein
MYWQRLGDLPYALALQKLYKSDASILQTLKKHKVITVKKGNIIIEFLDEQLNEFKETSVKRANAANKRWKNASEMQVHSKSNAIREDNIREEKKKEKKISNNTNKVVDKSTAIHKTLIADFTGYYEKEHQSKYIFKNAKDGAGMKSIITQIKTQWEYRHKTKPTDAEIRTSFDWLLKQTKKDSWINTNLSIALIGSKFNEIINLGKKTNGTGKKQVTGEGMREYIQSLEG